MNYIKIIESVLSRLDYPICQVKKLKGMRNIRVSFPSEQVFLTQTLLSSLMSIKGLHLVAINFEFRYMLFVY